MQLPQSSQREQETSMEFARKVGNQVAERAAVSTVTATGKGLWQQMRYVLDCKENVEELRNKLQSMKQARARVLHQVDYETKELYRQVEEDVLTWLKNVDQEIYKVEKILEEYDASKKGKGSLVGLLPNVKSQYKFSRKAKMEAPAAKELAEPTFVTVGYHNNTL